MSLPRREANERSLLSTPRTLRNSIYEGCGVVGTTKMAAYENIMSAQNSCHYEIGVDYHSFTFSLLHSSRAVPASTMKERSARDLPQAQVIQTETKTHTVRTVKSQSSSSFPASSFACGGSGFQVIEASSKESRIASILGRFCGRVAQHRPSIFHKLSVNHVPFTPSGLPGRSPSVTFRVTIWSLNDAKGGWPVRTS